VDFEGFVGSNLHVTLERLWQMLAAFWVAGLSGCQFYKPLQGFNF